MKAETFDVNETLAAIFEIFNAREIDYANAVFLLEVTRTMLVEAALDVSEGVPIQ